ncbi:MAG: protease HtpX [Gammaproteobacteria bacterium]|nr:protease HtpX [Gammaproteobacteria bacterium]
MRRIFYFLLINGAVMLMFGLTASLLGINNMAQTDLTSLLILSGVVGFTGSLISLALSKTMAKRSAGVVVIETPQNNTEQWLVDTVRRQAEMAGIGMPEVGIFNSPAPNAFATGMSKNSSLVAVSTGLLQHMDKNEVEAVLGHEVAHVANGDMVTMALLQGVLNTFVFFLARVIGSIIDSAMRRDGERGGAGIGYYAAVLISELVLGLLANMIAAWYSRQREFRADEGGAAYSSRQNMISALQALQRPAVEEDLPEALAAFGIKSGQGSMLRQLFSTHPPLEDRIAHLRNHVS